MGEHTKTPWRIIVFSPIGAAQIRSDAQPKQEVSIAHCDKMENAQHIVRAVNSYQTLIDALNAIAAWQDGDKVGSHFDEPGSAEIAREALRKVQS